jgi:phage gp29-like protein
MPAKKQLTTPVATAAPLSFSRISSKEALAAQAWIQNVNPLRGLTVARAQQLYDSARRGDTVWLQWLYNEIEAIDPTLLVCVERRGGALVDLDWTIREKAARRVKGWDEELVKQQSEFLEAAFGAMEDANLWDAVEHLSLGFFRGFSHVAPVWTFDGLGVERFDLLASWNFVRDIPTGTWLWNPRGHMFADMGSLTPIPDGELCSVVRPRHINYPALAIYLRAALGEKHWGKFVECYGIPPVIIVRPPDVQTAKKMEWTESARQVAEGGSGALPAGSEVKYAEGGRGVNPFLQFLDHQQQLVVLMSTGGMFTSLTGSTGLGQGASKAHQETWRAIVQRDAAIVSAAINTSITDVLLDRAFPGQPHLAAFGFETEARPTPNDVFDTAAKARAAGYRVEQAELQERTGYTLEKEVQESRSPGVQEGIPGGGRLNRLDPVAKRQNPVAKSTCRAARVNAAAAGAKRGMGDSGAFSGLAAMRKDLEPFVEALAEVVNADLDDVEVAAKVNALRGQLAQLPKGRALAEEFEMMIAEAWAKGVKETEGTKGTEGTAVANAERKCRAKDPDNCRTHGTGQFADDPEPKEPAAPEGEKSYESDESKWPKPDPKQPAAEYKATNKARGDNAMKKVVDTKKDVPGAMTSKALGPINFKWGQKGNPAKKYDGGHGFSHIIAKHGEDAARKVPETLAYGKYYPDETESDAYTVVHGNNVVSLKRDGGD